jgi:polyferredoxin
MPLGKQRDRILQGLTRARGAMHRHTRWRWAIAIACTAGIAALPAFDLLRFDFWRGRHVWLGQELGLVEVAKRFAFPFLGVNVLIVVASRFVGRYLCGFVCFYGALARLSEWLRFRGSSPARRAAGLAALLGGVALAFFACLRWLGQAFCRDWCPSGVYFALLGHQSLNGVHFAHPETCTDCKACDTVCPVDLKPREMSGGAYRAGRGFYPDALSNFALCVRCGDCVVACEDVNEARRDGPVTLRMGWLAPEARDSVDRTEEAAEHA